MAAEIVEAEWAGLANEYSNKSFLNDRWNSAMLLVYHSSNG